MHQSQKARFRLHNCKLCGSRSSVSWINEKSAGGDDWQPAKPHCTSRSCPLYDPREAAADDWDLGSATRAVGS